jgi:hypothetical protein
VLGNPARTDRDDQHDGGEQAHEDRQHDVAQPHANHRAMQSSQNCAIDPFSRNSMCGTESSSNLPWQ